MAQINTYTSKVTAQGQINANIDQNAFGANVGAAIQKVGQAGMSVADQMFKNQEQEDVTNIHAEMSKKRLEWTQQLEDMTNQTKPGDQTLAPRVIEGVKQDFEQLAPIAQTKAGQQLFARMSGEMTAVFGAQAIAKQSYLNGEFAKVQVLEIKKDLGGTALKDYTQWDSLTKQADMFIDDPKGRFANLNQAQREEVRRDIHENILYSAARGFTRQNPTAVLGTVDSRLQGAITNAVSGPAAQPPAEGLPPNLNASVVKPFNYGDISSRAATIKAPSKYDQYFVDAAQLYNLDPRELKMRAVVESNLDPKAVSNQKAQGIMQFTAETAKQLGVNAYDPEASIFAAAKLIAGYRDKAGGDMSKVDLMYYGGEGGTRWGSNTYQYAANMAALRQGVGLGSSVVPQQFQVPPSVKVGEAAGGARQRTGIPFIDNLPPEKQFQILTEAEHYKGYYETQAERSRVDREHVERKAQDFKMKDYQRRIWGGDNVNEMELANDNTLTFEQRNAVKNLQLAHSNEKAANMETKAHPEKVMELMKILHTANDDPAKQFSDKPVWDAYTNGEISKREFDDLSARFNGLKDPSSNPFYKRVRGVEDHVWRGIQGNPQIQGKEMASPGTAAAIAAAFSQDLEAKIQQYRKENKNPASLLDHNSPDYVLKPGYLTPYITMTGGGAPLAAPAPEAAPAAKMPTYKEYDKLTKGAKYTDPDGNIRIKG